MHKQPIELFKAKKKGKLISQENHYQKLKLIGSGTFGKVYLAKNNKDNKLYAVKEVLQDPKYKNRELSIISVINHENIIFMIDYYIRIFEKNYYLNIVMEFMPTSLNIIINNLRKQKIPMKPEIRKILIFQLFKALYYMQLNTICHRDMKPSNVLINDQTFELKICDFGSAKILERKEKNVAYIVSRYYRAPQLLMGSSTYSTEIDVWSAGCMIVQFLTLEPIFPGDSSVEQLIEIIKILGTPPKKLIKTYEQANLDPFLLPKIKSTSWSKILQKYNPEPELVDLIDKILTYDSEKRIRPCEVLCHQYLQDLPKLEKYTQKLPQLFDFSSLNYRRNKTQICILQKFYGKNNQLRLKKSESKLTLDIVGKQQTLPSTTSPQEQKTLISEQQTMLKTNQSLNQEKPQSKSS